MSEPQQPPVPPTDPNAPSSPSFPAESYPPAPPAASPLPAEPQYPSGGQPPTAPQYPSAPQYAPQHATPQQAAPQPPFGQPAPQPPYGQPTPQHPNAPHPGAAPYAATQPNYASAPSAPARPKEAGDPLGRTAFIIALAALGVALITTLSGPFLWLSSVNTYSTYGVVGGFVNLLVLAGAATALILGLLAARRPGSKLLPGIAIGIGGAQVASIVVSWISTLFYSFF